MTHQPPQISLAISDASGTAEARRVAAALANSLGFGSVRCGELAIVLTELCRNAATHGHGGEIIFMPWKSGKSGCLDLLVLDKGPGIQNLSQCMEDGYSTAGTPGTGLGAVARLTDRLEVFSQPGAGTAIFVRVMAERGPRQDDLNTGSVSLPIKGEDVCGDAWTLHCDKDRAIFMVADGLGHGVAANEAAEEAIGAVRNVGNHSPAGLLEVAHGRLQKTRGAAVAVAEIEFRNRLLRYAGVGNIAGSIVHNGHSRSMVSMNGTVGHQIEKIQEFSYPWEAGSLLVMHSDGLTSRWNMENYAGLAAKHPALIAGVIYRDFKRGRDDATIVVARQAKAA